MYQLELFDKSEQQIRDEIEYYFDYLKTSNDAFGGMPVCPFLKAEMETIQQQMVEAKKNERTNALKEVKRLCKEFGFTAGMLKGSLAEGRRKK